MPKAVQPKLITTGSGQKQRLSGESDVAALGSTSFGLGIEPGPPGERGETRSGPVGVEEIAPRDVPPSTRQKSGPLLPVEQQRQEAMQRAGPIFSLFERKIEEEFQSFRTEQGVDPTNVSGAWTERFDKLFNAVKFQFDESVRDTFLYRMGLTRAHYAAKAAALEKDLGDRAARGAVLTAWNTYANLIEQDPAKLDLAVLEMGRVVDTSQLGEEERTKLRAQSNEILFRSYQRAQLKNGDLSAFERELETGRLSSFVSDDLKEEAFELIAAERRARWEDQRIRAAETGNRLSSEPQILAEFPGERGQVMARRQRRGEAVDGAWQESLLATPHEVAKTVEELRRDKDIDAEALRGFELALEERDRQLHEDSQLYVLNHSPAVQGEVSLAKDLAAQAETPNLAPEARASLLQRSAMHEQRAIGLSISLQNKIKGKDAAVSVLTTADAEALVSEFRALPPDRWAGKLAELDRRYGPYAGRVRTELMAAGLPGLIGTTADLLERQSPFAQDLIAVAQKPREQQMAEIGEVVAGGISLRVLSHSAPFLRFLHDNGRDNEIKSRLDTAERLAWLLFQKWGGRNADRAAQEAVEALFPFRFMGPNLARPDRWPQGVSFRDGVYALGRIQEDLVAEDLDFSQARVFNDMEIDLNDDQMARLYADHVRGHGFWRNTCNGAQLMDGAGRPVVRKDGSFVIVGWDEIEPRPALVLEPMPLGPR